MSVEESGQKQAGTRYDTADSALRRRSVELVRCREDRDVRWQVRLRLAGKEHEVLFDGLKSRPAKVPAVLQQRLAGISGGNALEPERGDSESCTADRTLRTAPPDASTALTGMFGGLADQVLVCELAVRLELPDAVHQLRVACRSFRAVLKSAAPFLEQDQVKSLNERLRELARRYAPARDAEVIAQLLPATSELLCGAVEPAAITRLRNQAREQSTGTAREAGRYLHREEHLRLLADLRAFALQPPFSGREKGLSARSLGNRLLGRSLRTLERVAEREHADAGGGEELLGHVHDVRKAVKRVRYVNSAVRSAGIRPRKRLRRAARDARKYQRELGAIIDRAVLVEWLAQTAAALAGEGDRYDLGLLQGAAAGQLSEALGRSEILVDGLRTQLESGRRPPTLPPPTG